MHLIKRNHPDNTESPQALFDASHGQPNWAQTGFPSRELHSNFAGLTEILCRLGFHCRSTAGAPLSAHLESSRLLIIPPPVGRYDARRERWRCEKSSLFTPDEICEVLRFLHSGGCLLAFAYRFGDAYTQTNLGDLCLALGCRLNHDAVLDVRALRKTDPLHLQLDTPAECLPLSWSRNAVGLVRWRPGATFAVLPGAAAGPLALSTGGSCLSFDLTLRCICFASLPLAIAGRHGNGRFVLFGGPHLFESSALGLLAVADNTRFLRNVLKWLLADAVGEECSPPQRNLPTSPCHFAGLSRVASEGEGERTIASVERILRQTGVLKALNQARWLP